MERKKRKLLRNTRSKQDSVKTSNFSLSNAPEGKEKMKQS